MRLRCHHATALALASNRHFCHLPWIGEKLRDAAVRGLAQDGDARWTLELPPADARALLEPELPGLISKQKPTGLWRTKHAREISYYLLRALDYAGLLDALRSQLRYDPFAPFHDDDWFGIAIRRRLLNDDATVPAKRLLAELTSLQRADGSWDGTVVATVHHLDILTDTGLNEAPPFARGIAFLFACLQDEVVQMQSGLALGHQMITTPDRSAEFRSATALKPLWTPASACYWHLPVLQTGYALRCLNRAGYQDDPRVLAACQNIADLHDRFGGLCATNFKFGLRAERQQAKAH